MAKVKVKILKWVGGYEPGQEVEVEEEVSKALCRKTEVLSGGGETEVVQKAMLLEDAVKLKSMPVDFAKISQTEAKALGKKNIIMTPQNDDFAKKVSAAVAQADNAIKKNKPKEAETKRA